MNSLILSIVLCSLLATSYSAVFFERQLAVPGHESLCYDKEDDIFYKKGEEMKWKGKGCARKICLGPIRSDDRVYAEIQTCGKVYVPPGCRMEYRDGLPYPECCPDVICPESPK